MESVWYNVWGALESIEDLQPPEEGLEGTSWLIYFRFTLSTLAAIYPAHLRHLSRSSARVPEAACTQLVRAGNQVSKEDPVLQISGLCTLITGCWFSSQRCRPRGSGHHCYIYPYCYRSFHSTKVTFRGLKGPATYLNPSFLSLSHFWKPRIKD